MLILKLGYTFRTVRIFPLAFFHIYIKHLFVPTFFYTFETCFIPYGNSEQEIKTQNPDIQ